MYPDPLWQNVDIAVTAGFHTVLFWGAEWWYWLRQSGGATMWDAAKSIVEEHR